jgi:hypothetical protein
MGLLETVMRGDALSRSVAALLPLAMSVLSWAVIFYKGWMLRCAARRAMCNAPAPPSGKPPIGPVPGSVQAPLTRKPCCCRWCWQRAGWSRRCTKRWLSPVTAHSS